MNRVPIFQSTHPLRDATCKSLTNPLLVPYFNPRTPYGMRLNDTAYAGGDTQFQSTHPLRDATAALKQSTANETISIHAPLTGCDIQSN